MESFLESFLESCLESFLESCPQSFLRSFLERFLKSFLMKYFQRTPCLGSRAGVILSIRLAFAIFHSNKAMLDSPGI